MFVLKLEFLKLISIALDRTIRRMISEIQVSETPRETLKLEQVSDNVYNLRNVPLAHLSELMGLIEEIDAQGLAPSNSRDFIDILHAQVSKALDRTYGVRP